MFVCSGARAPNSSFLTGEGAHRIHGEVVKHNEPGLIDRALPLWGIEREGRNVDVELFAGRGHHPVGSSHETRRPVHRTPPHTFKIPPRLFSRPPPHHP